jgi:putative tryptophan/tyrosine transport system substrate-binding protein
MLRSRFLLAGAAFAATTWWPSRPAQAQPAPRLAVIGYIAQRAGPWHLDAAFLDGLRELGYVEGRHFRMEHRWGPNVADLPALAADLVRLRVDVIVSSGYPSNKAAKDATASVPIPVVMATSGDAVQEGLVATLSRPGGNITGLSVLNRELTGKRLQVIREAVPGLKRIGALFNGSNPAMPPQFSEVQAAAQTLGLQAVPLDVSFPAGIEPAFASSSKSGTGAVMVLSDSSTIAHRAELSAAALRHRMPTIFSNRDYIRAGGMMSYGPNLAENFKQAAAYVDRILKGANPATMPVEQPTRFELIVNRGTAKGLGITLPQSLLVRADDFVD